jgi:hypothetical protein
VARRCTTTASKAADETDMSPDRAITIPLHVEALDVGADFVLVDLSTGGYFGLNRVGARMWKLLADGRTPGQVADTLAADYGVPRERIEADLDALLAVLRARKLVDP